MALVHAPLNTRPLELIDQLENQSQQSHYEPPGTAVTESDEVQLRHRLATLEALHGAGSEATLNTLDDLFTVLFNQGRYSSAEVIARKSQDACTTLHGGDHARTGSSLVQLGILFAAQGNYPKSLSLLEEAAQSILHTVGVHSSSYLQVQSYLGMTYLQLGSTTEAIRRLRQTESTAIQVLGKAHSVTLSSQLSLLEALVAHGQFLEAEERATALQLALSTTSFGLWQKESSVNVTASLGMIYMKTFRLNEARQVLNLSWQQAEESLTKEHLTTLRILAYAAVACMESGQQEEALAKFDSCIGASERVLGLNHPFTQYVMGRRIFCYV
jgi:tetratricopeptide (TPR) repeat protein